MFKNLSERLSGIFEKLKSRGSLTEGDVDAALREVRIALLEADVALPVLLRGGQGTMGAVKFLKGVMKLIRSIT